MQTIFGAGDLLGMGRRHGDQRILPGLCQLIESVAVRALLEIAAVVVGTTCGVYPRVQRAYQQGPPTSYFLDSHLDPEEHFAV
jgi:hypothetical protein